MKIFMLVSRVPWPLEKGDKLRAYHQLKQLAKNHEVFLCCLSDKEVHPDAMAQLKSITPHVVVLRLNILIVGWRLFRALFSSKPFQVHYFFQSSAKRKVKALIDEFKPDNIYCQLIRTSEYVKHFHNYSKTLDYMDALSAGLQRRVGRTGWILNLFVREESKRLKNYEHLIFDYFEHHTIISAQDRDLIFHPERKKIEVVPNGIDSTFFTPSNDIEKKYDLVFTGNMSYPPNVDCALRLVHEILPLVHQKMPGVKLLIAGATPSRQVMQLQSEFVEVTGWMDDIRTAYSSSKIFMAPMRTGSGLQNKLLEAMCMEIPCVTSQIVARAMEAVHGEHLLIEETNEQLAECVIKLLNTPDVSNEMAKRGRQFVVSKFNWEATTDKISALWKS